MEVRNCRGCGKLYNYIGGPYRNLCPNCIEKIEEKYLEVKEYIQDHHNATMTEVAEECDVSTRQIEQWIRDERLVIADDSPIGITCERCGASIKVDVSVKDVRIKWQIILAQCMVSLMPLLNIWKRDYRQLMPR